MQMAAVPYRDIIDINMPLIYFIHVAAVAIGGMGDMAWRAFDLAATALVSGLILVLVWPAGRAAAIQAVLIVLVTHLLLGPYAAGQRDYLITIPALAAAVVSARAAENPQRYRIDLFLAGVFAMVAASIKPTGILLLPLPAITMGRLRWREAGWMTVGAAATGFPLLGLWRRSAHWGLSSRYRNCCPVMLRWVRAQCPRFSETLLFGWLRRPASRLPPR